MENMLCGHCHHIPLDEVVEIMETDVSRGLSAFEVKHRLERFGFNIVTVKRKTGPIKRFLLQFHNPLIYILLASSLITAILKEWIDASVIMGVVLVNAAIGFIQESRAEGAIESLKKMMTTEATVKRDGSKVRIPSKEIVPGEVVVLQAGDKVPADLR
ncbi:cation transporting ATPase, partial [sediment metagenome]